MAIAVNMQPGVTDPQRLAIEGPPPDGYGRIIPAPGGDRPSWLDAGEIVARHLPLGMSERKAGFIVGWEHPFRLRSDHPWYLANDARPAGGIAAA